MGSKIDTEFLRNVQETIKTSPEEEIAVIVTYDPNIATTDISPSLKDAGLKVENRFPEINSVSGKIRAKSIEKLLEVAGVTRVEPDSKVYALGKY